MVLLYSIESLPKKFRLIKLSSNNLKCSTHKEQQPTVSALSSLFSLPALIAKKSIR